MASLESSAEGAPSPPSDGAIPAAVPAAREVAEPVERGRLVVDRRDEDSVDSGRHSPKSFNSDELFEDVEDVEEQISDHDLDRLLGPVPLRRTKHMGGDRNAFSLEMDSIGNEDARRRRPKQVFCPCCPAAIRRGPCQLMMAATGHDGSAPSPRVGNMIVVFPRCFHKMGFGIMGPHWFGPICCFGLLTIGTIFFAPRAYHNVGPISAATCLVFYIVGVVSLLIVACSDPGVVQPEAGGKNGYAGLPSNVSAGRGWRYCDMCSVYQPPGAVHCPECNVCIEGYDHHCPWMGTCIGGKNFTSFMSFNVTWLFYLFYAIIWVLFVGNTFSDGARDASSDD
ncbi:hypothetical protein ACHAXT_012626 [Thalassiosira profunda]